MSETEEAARQKMEELKLSREEEYKHDDDDRRDREAIDKEAGK